MTDPDPLVCYCCGWRVSDVTAETPYPPQCTGCWGDLRVVKRQRQAKEGT